MARKNFLDLQMQVQRKPDTQAQANQANQAQANRAQANQADGVNPLKGVPVTGVPVTGVLLDAALAVVGITALLVVFTIAAAAFPF